MTMTDLRLVRRVEPELLDQLPADDPRAIRARRDLKRANAIILQHLVMAHTLLKYADGAQPRVLVDIGSGDGTFVLRVARRLARRWHNVHVILLDQQSIVSQETRDGFAALQWTVEPVAANVLDFFSRPRSEHIDVITANLFLHHLQDPELRQLLARAAAMTRLFVACELRRTRLVREMGRLQWLIGAGDVVCYDAVVSARASFLGQEISALWPTRDGWDLFERAVGPLAHVFVARRRPA
jgi:SAM-dependent methyltransferase